MKSIPIRSIQPQESKANLLEGFKIRSIEEVLAGNDMSQDLHRHDFYFILEAPPYFLELPYKDQTFSHAHLDSFYGKCYAR